MIAFVAARLHEVEGGFTEAFPTDALHEEFGGGDIGFFGASDVGKHRRAGIAVGSARVGRERTRSAEVDALKSDPTFMLRELGVTFDFGFEFEQDHFDNQIRSVRESLAVREEIAHREEYETD